MASISRREALTAAVAAAVAAGVGGEASRTEAGVTRLEDKMQDCASKWLASLGGDLAQKAHFEFSSDERYNWHYIPRARRGVAYKEMSPPQQEAARALLLTGLSHKGLERTDTIRHLENVLKEIEHGTGPTRDPDLYYFTVFGQPSADGAWGWRYEGHHVSLNFTLSHGSCVASTPMFFGANPAEVRDGPMKGTRTLAAEEDLARALVKHLSADQRAIAVISDKAPDDILTAASRKAAIQEDKGIAFSALGPEDQGMLMQVVDQYLSLMTTELRRKRLDRLHKAGVANVKFAWMGGLERGDRHYYRVQGATFLIEYDNTQNDANHIHSVWRDFDGDWGADLLAMHYESGDHHHDHA